MGNTLAENGAIYHFCHPNMYNRWPYQRRQAAADNCLVRNLKAISNLDLGQFTPILDLPVADLAEAMYTTGSSIKQGILRAKDVQAMEAAATVALQKVGKTLALLHCRCDSSTYSVRQVSPKKKMLEH